MGMRYLRESQVIRCFFVRPDQKDAKTQLTTHAIQITASNWVGQVAVQPLQTKANHWRGSWRMSDTVSRGWLKCPTGAWRVEGWLSGTPRSPRSGGFGRRRADGSWVSTKR